LDYSTAVPVDILDAFADKGLPYVGRDVFHDLSSEGQAGRSLALGMTKYACAGRAEQVRSVRLRGWSID
jgi:hypothetical protein